MRKALVVIYFAAASIALASDLGGDGLGGAVLQPRANSAQLGEPGLSNRETAQVDPVLIEAGEPALDFRFAENKWMRDSVTNQQSLITFSRSAAQSPGTYVGSDGLIHDAAVNLQIYSEQFDNAAWGKISATVSANQIVSPDGKQTADEINFSSLGTSYVYEDPLYTTGVYTFSAWYKGTAGETAIMQIRPALGFPDVQKTITFTGEWQRESVTSENGARYLYPADSRAGGTASSFHLWGAQLEETDASTMAPTAYIHTTSQALAAPRFDHEPTSGNVTTNLALYSEMFEQSYWTKPAGTTIVANQIVAPDGKQTADAVVNSATGDVSRTVTSLTSGASYTLSFYLKAGTTSSVKLQSFSSGTYWMRSIFDLSSGTVSSIQNGTASIEDVGNGWYRCSVTGVISATSATFWFIPQTVGTHYAWGAQLEKASTAGTYVRTLSETRSISDAVAPSLGLLVEEQRTNLETQSVSLLNYDNNAISATNSTVTLGQSDPWGGTNAGLFEGDGSGTSYSFGVVKSSADTETFSIWLKAGTASVARIQIGASGTTLGVYADVDLSAGTIGPAILRFGSFTAISSSIQAWGNGWYRCSVSATSPAGNHYAYVTFPSANTTDNYSFAAPQWEVGAFPTSYIPTAGTSQTRYADIAAVQDEDFSTTNLLAYSESFDVGWTTASPASVSANVTTAPDGQSTADKLQEATVSTNGKQLSQTVTPPASAVFSIYAKADERQWIRMQFGGSADYAFFDVGNGAVGTVTAGAYATIHDAGNGWYRCNFYDVSTSGGVNASVFIGSADNVINYAGEIGKGIYLWGASLTATEYPVEYTTTRNLLTDSQDFERSSWTKSGTTIGNDAALAPDGTLTADSLVEQTTTGAHYLRRTGLSMSNAVASIYIKNIDHTYLEIDVGAQIGVQFDVDGVPFFNGDDRVTALSKSIESVGNGWYRVSIESLSVPHIYINLKNGTGTGGFSYAGTGTGILLWGAQTEPGTTATDYVRTVDVVGKDYGWYEPTEGTVFVEAQTDVPDYGLDAWVYKIDGASNDLLFYRNSFGTPGALIQSRAFSSDVVLAINNIDPDDAFKNAVGMKYNDFYMSEASQFGLDASGTLVEKATAFEFGRQGSSYFNGHISRLTYWPVRQSNSTLQVITQ